MHSQAGAWERGKIKERAEYEANWKNQLSDAVTDIASSVFGENSEEALATAVGIGVAGASIVGGYGVYKLDDKLNDGALFKKLSGKKTDESQESNKQSKSNKQNESRSETKNNPSEHIDTPKEKYEFANSQIEESRTNLKNYNEELSQVQGKKESLHSQIYNAKHDRKMPKAKREDIIARANEQLEDLGREEIRLNTAISDVVRYYMPWHVKFDIQEFAIILYL